jgi:hypothetical protein
MYDREGVIMWQIAHIEISHVGGIDNFLGGVDPWAEEKLLCSAMSA